MFLVPRKGMRELRHSQIGCTSSKKTMSLSLFAEGLYKHNKQRMVQHRMILPFGSQLWCILSCICHTVYIFILLLIQYIPKFQFQDFFDHLLRLIFIIRDRFCPKNLRLLCQNFINWILSMHMYHTSHPHMLKRNIKKYHHARFLS